MLAYLANKQILMLMCSQYNIIMCVCVLWYQSVSFSMQQYTLCMCVLCRFVFKCVWVSPLLLFLCCSDHMSDYLPISFVCRVDTHTKHTRVVAVCCVCGFLLLSPPLLSFLFLFYLLSHLIRYHVCLIRSLPFFSSYFHLALPFSIPHLLLLFFHLSFIFLPFSQNIILASVLSGKKAGCICVMRKFKSLKEDCRIVCTKLIFQGVCVHVSMCLYVYVLYLCFSECRNLHIFVAECVSIEYVHSLSH